MGARRRIGRPWRAALGVLAAFLAAAAAAGAGNIGWAMAGPNAEVAQTAGERARERRREEEELRRRDRMRERREEREREIRARREEWREERQLRIEEKGEIEALRAREERELRRLRIESELERRREQGRASRRLGRVGADRRELLGRFPQAWVRGILEGRVETGWSEEAVLESRGEPDRITFTPAGEAVWHYGDRRILFKDGKVSEPEPGNGGSGGGR